MFRELPGIEGWHEDASGAYFLTVTDPKVTAPELTRALVRAGADVLGITESLHSLEDVYLELMDSDGKTDGESS